MIVDHVGKVDFGSIPIAVKRRVVQVEQHIGDRVVVEAADRRRQIEFPATDRTDALERQEAFFAIGKFEHAGIVHRAAQRDRIISYRFRLVQIDFFSVFSLDPVIEPVG